MPKSPFQADRFQVAPSQPGTRLIESDGDGNLRLEDVSGDVRLQDLVGIRNIDRLLIVGHGGQGAPYTNIQEAINAVPENNTTPTAILVFPGSYQESLVLDRNHITLLGMGDVTVSGVAGSPTLTIREGDGVPERVTLHSLSLVHTEDNSTCLFIEGGEGSSVGSSGIEIKNCRLDNLGAGGYTLDADTCGSVLVEGGYLRGGLTVITRFVNVTRLVMRGQSEVASTEILYDTSLPEPVLSGGDVLIQDITTMGDLSVTLSGAGGLTARRLSQVQNILLGGDRFFSLEGSTVVGSLSVMGDASLSLRDTRRQSLSGTGSVDEDVWVGSVEFDASTQETVTFDVGRVSISYVVSLESPSTNTFFGVASKTLSGFEIEASSPFTGTIHFVVRG